MQAVNIADAKARLSKLVDQATAGEDITIARRGKPLVRLVPVEAPKRPPIDFEGLRRLRASIPYQTESAVDLVRRMRDEDDH